MAAVAGVRGHAFVAFGVRRFDARPNISMTLAVTVRFSVLTSTQSACFRETKRGRVHQRQYQRQPQPRSDDHARYSRDGHANGRNDGF